MAKWNEALRIEEALGPAARFAGLDETPSATAGGEAGGAASTGAANDRRKVFRSRAARSPFRSPTPAAFASTRAFPTPRRRSGHCAGARPSRLRRGRACGRPTLSGQAPCRASFGTTSTSTRAGVSEDCLYLNVWTPAAPGDGPSLPIMVWIHGGGSVVGSGAEPRYDGARLAARGIVVVTLNHRLNALGFLAHPELTAESEHRASGNYGFLDLVAALGWVEAQHRRLRRRPGQGHGRWRIRRFPSGERADGLAARQGIVRPRHRRKRGVVRFTHPRARRPSPKPRPAESCSCARSEPRSLASVRAARLRPILAAAPGLGFRPIVDRMVSAAPAGRRFSPPASRAMCR